MDTIGDVIGRGWNAGRGIGQDFASWKYNRGEAKLRQQLESEAKAANKPLDQFIRDNPDRLQQYEDAARELFTTSGAQKRGVTGNDGAALNVESASAMQQRLATGTNRAASQQVLAGNVEDSQRTLGAGNALVGNYDATRANALQADQIKNSTAAINPDGTFASDKAMQGNALLAAQQGDTAGASAEQEQARAMRFKLAQQHTGDLQMMMSDPAAYGMDNIVGKINALVGLDGRFGSGVLAQADKSGGITLMRGDAPVMTLMKNGQPTEDVTKFLANASTDYEGAVQAHVAELKGQATAETARTGEIQMEAFKAGLDIAKNMAKVDPTTGAAASTLSEAMGGMKNAGWTPTKLDDGGVLLTGKDGRVVVLSINPEGATNDIGLPLPKYELTDTDGNRVSPAMMQGAPEIQQLAQATIAMDAAQQQSQVAQRGELAKMGVQLIGALTSAMGAPVDMGNAASRVGGALGGDGKFPIEETDNYVNSIMGKVGQVSGDSRSIAKQLMGALVQQESGGDHSAVSVKGARGVTQVMPKTGKDPGFGVTPLQNDSREEYMRFGEDYLTAMLDRYDGNPRLALAAYNAGPGAVDKWVARGNAPARGGADTRAAAVSTSPINIPGNTVAKAGDGVALPKKQSVAATNPSKDVQALAARRQILEQAVREFNAQESTSPVSAWTPGGEAVSEGLDPAQQRQFAALSRELTQVRTAERQARMAVQRNARANSEKQEVSRMQEKYGLPPADPEASAALARWSR